MKPTDLASARVDWDKLDAGIDAAAQKEKFELRGEYQYQKDALNAVHTHFLDHDRGKLIMACGTGKTFLSLKIAEHETANRGLILVLVPSIALVGQTLCTWCEQCEVTLQEETWFSAVAAGSLQSCICIMKIPPSTPMLRSRALNLETKVDSKSQKRG